MELLHTFRRRRGSLGRALVGLFAATWLGLAVQPCMAHEAGPGAPPAGHADHQGHTDHAAEAAPAGPAPQHCPHCPPEPAGGHDCGTAVALECDSVGPPALPAKHYELPQPGDFLLAAAPALTIAVPTALCLGHAASPLDSPHPPGATLQQRYCTYLK